MFGDVTWRLRDIQVIVCAGLLTWAGLAIAQAPASRDLHLRGDRFKPLTYDQLTPAQKALVEHVLAGERGTMNGPFNVTLRSPEMGDLAQKLGAYLRFHSSLPDRLKEFAILMTARYWTAQYEWSAHKKLALAAGLKPAVIEAVSADARPATMAADEEAVYNFAHELLYKKQVSDATFKAAVNRFGERSVVDLTGTIGYYCFVSMMLNIDRYPLPDGDKPELTPLR
jgi:4-carboxymuconolactone decarboxylase